MFGRRPDGKKIKGKNGFDRMVSLLVAGDRDEATNYFQLDIETDALDRYIEQKRINDGIEYTYRDVVVATLVRVFYLRPRLNQFVYAGNFYQRNYIDVAMAMQKDLRSGSEETTIKCRYTGKETIYEIKQALDAKINEAIKATNNTDNFTGGMNWMPTWLFRLVVKLLKGLDRIGLLSDKFLMNTSPFHSSIFFADMKSVRLDAVLHHLYNFGNCGFFCSMGKEKVKVVADERTLEISAKRVMELGISEDERFADGYYYSSMLKLARRIFTDLTCLEVPPHDDDIKKLPLEPKERKKRAKLAKKQAKIDAKAAKKQPQDSATAA